MLKLFWDIYYRKFGVQGIIAIIGLLILLATIIFAIMNIPLRTPAAQIDDRSFTDAILQIIKEEKEKAYYEGQKDALTGNIRIVYKDKKWIWSKSPWDDGAKPKFDPK